MKLSNLLLAATVFFAAGITIADAKPKEKEEQAQLSNDTESGNPTFSWGGNSATVTLFVANDGWDSYFVCGYDKDGNIVSGTKTRVATSDNLTNLTAAQVLEDFDVPETAKENIAKFTGTHKAYQLEVAFGDNVETIGLIGGGNNDGEKFLVYSYDNITKKKSFFSAIDDNGNILYLGTDNWSSGLKFNNGAVFLVGAGQGGAGGTFGTPLPTPVVTLLIALGLGAGLVMYRSRKQQAEA